VTRIGLAGCGSVSGPYLADLRSCRCASVVALCDPVAGRAEARAREFGIASWFTCLRDMLDGAEFDLLVNTTPMQEHYAVSLAALQAGKHVWSEKPLAGSLAEGRDLINTARDRGVRIWCAPTVVASPAYARIEGVLRSGQIGTVYAARAWYGHGGPGWGPWFYARGGGAMFDLAVYNMTTLTGLLGPALSVTAMTGTAIPERTVDGLRVCAQAEDNLALIMDHGSSVFSVVQSGFVYGPHWEERTIELVGTRGGLSMLGWDWLPNGVEVWREDGSREMLCSGAEGYSWEQGASHVATSLATGSEPVFAVEHAFHVLEVMLAAHESAATGHAVTVGSRFAGTEPAQGEAQPSPLDPDDHRR